MLSYDHRPADLADCTRCIVDRILTQFGLEQADKYFILPRQTWKNIFVPK